MEEEYIDIRNVKRTYELALARFKADSSVSATGLRAKARSARADFRRCSTTLTQDFVLNPTESCLDDILGRHNTLLAMLRQSVYGRLAGYEDVNDADRLRVDPAMRRVVGGQAKEKEAASTSEMNRFETEMLSLRQNLTAMMNLSGTWIDLAQECAPLDKLILDLDSAVSATHGEQQGFAYNGYFECMCYHPLFLFNQLGDL